MINVSNTAPQTASPMSAPPQQATQQAAPPEANPELVSQAQSPVQEPKKNKNNMFLIGGIILAMVAIGGLASLFLVQQPQDTRQQASQCVEACPSSRDPSLLQSCTPPDGDGTSNDSLCNLKGRVESCGNVDYCCPAPGGNWSTNMTPCATPTPEPTPTVAPTATPEPTPTTAPTVAPTAIPTTKPTAVPTTQPTVVPTSSSSSSSSSTSTVAVNVEPTQPPLPSELPQTGPEDWLKYLSASLGAIGLGAVLFLFL